MKILVLMGGTSSEREVSLVSGSEVARALREKGHRVVEMDVKDELDPTGSGCDSGGPWKKAGPSERTRAGRGLVGFVTNPDVVSCDLVFVALHGGNGENGTVQALLDIIGKSYTGSGMLPSALAMDKFLSKRVFEHAGVPTPGWCGIEGADLRSVQDAVSRLGGLPVVTKPRDQGSTVGISIIKEESELGPAVGLALRFSPDVLVEKYVAGREITVGILGDKPLPVVEIIPETGFYDYECKYTKGKSKYVAPAGIPESEAVEAQEMALRAHTILGCADFSRVDFRLPHDGKPQCLEVNTIPGMTGTSLVPMAAQAIGIAFPELVDEICRLAVARRRPGCCARSAGA
jgi:D-alanine-D-alanine ligase